jgi:beta-aspartyl-peptidase (threonine type)
VLDQGGSALDAVEAVLKILEDDPLFNAGRGAVFTSEGKNELDAAIMDGANLKAGAVAGVTRTRHPISLARAVMEKSPYVMMAGPGADAFARGLAWSRWIPASFLRRRAGSRW